ncbi:MAG: sulfite exporter TauE/SafE family protein, partial [Thermoleophilia bacterium]|nr:sulfite exporter TauE/SafE family protein [Thermoleophilia bacterium]
MDWKLSLAGLLIGLLVGMTGMGGGSLMTPLLVIVFGFKPTVAIGTDILHGAVFKSFGAGQHRRLGHVHARLTVWMLLGSAPASLGGVALSAWLESRYGDSFEDAAKQVLGAALIVAGIGFFVKTFIHGRTSDQPFRLANRDRLSAVLIGIFG